MSAFIVCRHHIDALVAVAFFGPSGIAISPHTTWRPANWFDTEPPPDADMTWLEEHRRAAEPHDAHRLAEMLLLENVRSVNHRYPDSAALSGHVDDPPDWTAADATPLTTRRCGSRPTPVEALKLLDCYEYQSCEHPQWRTSEARRFCDALRVRLIGYVPGYDEAPWEWTQPLRSARAAGARD